MAGPYPPSDARNYVGFARQTVRGTGVAPTFWVPYIDSVDLDHQQGINLIKEAGTAGQVTYAEKASHVPTGRCSFLARPAVTSKLFALLLGSDTVTGTGPYVHTMIEDMVNMDYVTAEQNLMDEEIERFIDAAIAEITLSADVATPSLRCVATWMAGKPNDQGAATAESYETDRPFVLSDGVFTIDGSAATNVRRFEARIRMILGMEQVSDVVVDFIGRVGMEVELTLEQLATDITTEYHRTHYGTPAGTIYQKQATTGAFVGDFNYGTGGAARQLKLTLPNTDYSQAIYSGLQPDATELVKVTRIATARKVTGSNFVQYVGGTGDAAAYV